MAKPTLNPGYLGPQGIFKEVLTTFSHNNPEITTNANPFTICFKTLVDLKVTADLTCCQTENCSKEQIFTQLDPDSKTLSLIVLMPSQGYFKLQLFAYPLKQNDKRIPNVYNYLIHNTAPPPAALQSFPKQFAQWKEGCTLTKPYHLNEGDSAAFEVGVPKARSVAVTIDKEWFHFTKDPSGVWRGEVKGLAACRGKGMKAVLNANFVDDSTKYTSLLEYSL